MPPHAHRADSLPRVLRRATWLLCWLVTVALAACGEGGDRPPATATPAPSASVLVVATEGYVPPEAQDLLRSEAERAGVRVDLQPRGGALTLTSHEIPDTEPIFVRYWVPVVTPFRPLRGLSSSELLAIATGHLSDWSELTDEAGRIRMLLPEENAEELTALLGVPLTGESQGEHVQFKPLAEIPSLVVEDRSALALLPADAVDVRLRSLAVDGANAVTAKGDLQAYPLATRTWARDEGSAPSATAPPSAGDRSIASLRHRAAAPPARPARLLFTGDIVPARCVYARHLSHADFRHAFLELGPLLREADITVGSLDATLSDVGTPLGCTPTYNFLAPPESVEGLAFAGFDLLTVATNHAKDCGTMSSACDEALLDTLAHLREVGILSVGTGSDLLEARREAIISVQGTRFAFLGYDDIAPYYHADEGGPGTAPLEASFLREDIARARQAADVVVVLPHWGIEYTSVPTERQRELARVAVEAGAALVIGNHPHWAQAVEYSEGAFIAYSLGNFVFDQDWSLETQQGLMLEAVFRGSRLVSVDLVPIRIRDMHQPTLAPADEAREVLRRIEEASRALR